ARANRCNRLIAVPASLLVPGAGLEPARPWGRRILSPLRLPVPPSGPGQKCARREGEDGGLGRNRTGVHGFAGRCMTTLPPGLMASGPRLAQRAGSGKTKPRRTGALLSKLERETRLELATPTLARSCSTN